MMTSLKVAKKNCTKCPFILCDLKIRRNVRYRPVHHAASFFFSQADEKFTASKILIKISPSSCKECVAVVNKKRGQTRRVRNNWGRSDARGAEADAQTHTHVRIGS